MKLLNHREAFPFGAGALVGLMASNRPLYIFAAGVLAGLALATSVIFYRTLADGVRALGGRLQARRGVPPVRTEDMPYDPRTARIPY